MRILASLLAALIVGIPVVAVADPTPEGGEQSVEDGEEGGADHEEGEDDREEGGEELTVVEREAQVLIDQGVALRTEGKERAALDHFRRAFALSPSPRARGQMGLAEKSLRLYVESAASLEAALAATDDPWVVRNREALELAQQIVFKQLSTLLVRANVPAELWLNGEKLTDLPMPNRLRVLAGKARLEIRAPGHQTAKLERTLIAGEHALISVSLLPVVAPHPPLAPPPPIPVSGPPETPPDLAPWMYGSFALAGVGLGIGTGLAIYALDRKGARDAICPDATRCPTEEGVALDGSARDAANGATAAFVVGGVSLAAAAVLLILELSGPEVTASVDGLRWRF